MGTSSNDDEPRSIARDTLPAALVALLHDDERVYYAERPIRRAGGLGVWLIFALGLAFVPASVGGLLEVAHGLSALTWSVKKVAAVVFAGGLAALFFAFSLMLLTWPFLSERARRRSLVVVTSARVLRLVGDVGGKRPLRVKAWDVTACDDASVARRRGRSATLVLKERIRIRKSDDQPVYEWDALHGLPDADRALKALVFARARAHARVASST